MRRRTGLPARVSGELVLLASLLVISGSIRRQEAGKHLKHGLFAYFLCDLF
jgi:hypothetical protein